MRTLIYTRNPFASGRSMKAAALVGFTVLAAAVLGNLCAFTDEQSGQARCDLEGQSESPDANPRVIMGSTDGPGRPRCTPARAGKHSLAEKDILAALGTSTDVDFLDTPLEDALISLGKQHGINVWLDLQSMSDAGIARDQPISLRLKGVRLESVLNLVLEPCELDWVIQDEVLKITTRESADAHPEILSYNVQNLIDAGHTPDDLIASITTCVAPGSWSRARVKIRWQGSAFSGPAGCHEYPAPAGISRTGGVLVIRQSRRTHAQISRLLQELGEISQMGK